MRDLNNCIGRSHTNPRDSFNADLREVQIFTPHVWDNIHASHDMMMCDQTPFCSVCGSTSSAYRTEALSRPCGPTRNGYHDRILNTMPRGICPYKDKWRSGGGE